MGINYGNNSGVNGLSYQGVRATTPPNMLINHRAPTTKDSFNVVLGTLWLWPFPTPPSTNPQKSLLWILCGLQQNVATWVPIFTPGSFPSLTSTTLVTVTPYTVLLTDDVLLVDTATIGAPSNILLPNAPGIDGKTWIVKDYSGQGTAYPITVTTVGGAVLIDQATSYLMQGSYAEATFIYSLGQTSYSIDGTYNNDSQINIPPSSYDAGTGIALGVMQQSGEVCFHQYGDNNLAVGNGAGVIGFFSAGTYENSTFIGQSAGALVLASSDNTIVGFEAYSNQNDVSDLDSNDNTVVGCQAMVGIGGNAGTRNVVVGSQAMVRGQSNDNVAIGYEAMNLGGQVGCDFNVAIGSGAFSSATTGEFNVLIGNDAGIAYTTESNNININSHGNAADNHVLRIGAGTGIGNQELETAYICGIDGVDVGDTANVVTMVADQLGTAVITGAGGITVTPTANVITISGSGSVQLNVQYFTGHGTYTLTPTIGMTYCIAELVGAGASGACTTNPNSMSGGGGGGYVRSLLTAAQIGASQTVVVGTGGASVGATNAGNAGTASTLTTVASGTLSAGGGSGGNYASGANGSFAFALGGTCSGGDININGQASGIGICLGSSTALTMTSGSFGGNSIYGSGGAPASGGGFDGGAGQGYGSGGGSGLNNSGAGADGIVIITEYI